MSPRCRICGVQLAEGSRVLSVHHPATAEPPLVREVALTAADGALAYLCLSHTGAASLLEALAPDPAAVERRLRGALYQELDLLAYALEMEAAEQVRSGLDDDAGRTQQTRLGIRLAQRLVGGVPAPEVDRRLERWRATYRSKFPA